MREDRAVSSGGVWSSEFWDLFDCGVWKLATQAREAWYSNTCTCGAFVDSYRARVTHTTWGNVHMILEQSGDAVTVSLREFVDMNPELFAPLELPESARSQGCSLCYDPTF